MSLLKLLNNFRVPPVDMSRGVGSLRSPYVGGYYSSYISDTSSYRPARFRENTPPLRYSTKPRFSSRFIQRILVILSIISSSFRITLLIQFLFLIKENYNYSLSSLLGKTSKMYFEKYRQLFISWSKSSGKLANGKIELFLKTKYPTPVSL